MDQSLIYAIGSIGIGALLLFFGLRLMKVAVAVVGFLIGFSLVGWLLSTVSWDGWLVLALQVVGGLAVAAVAFSFYRFAVALSIAFMVGNVAHGIATSVGQNPLEALIISVIIGVVVFIIVQLLKVVDILFAAATSLQGASSVVYGVYALLHPAITTQAIAVLTLEWWWLLVWIVLAICGFAFQVGTRPDHEEV
jgi:hypothetical protein